MLWYRGLNPLPRGRCRLLLSRTPPPFSVTRQRPSAGHTQAPVVAYTVFGYCIKCHSLVMASQPRRLCQGKTVNQLRHYELKPDSLIMIDTRHFLLDCLLSVSVCLSVSLSLCVFGVCAFVVFAATAAFFYGGGDLGEEKTHSVSGIFRRLLVILLKPERLLPAQFYSVGLQYQCTSTASAKMQPCVRKSCLVFLINSKSSVTVHWTTV